MDDKAARFRSTSSHVIRVIGYLGTVGVEVEGAIVDGEAEGDSEDGLDVGTADVILTFGSAHRHGPNNQFFRMSVMQKPKTLN